MAFGIYFSGGISMAIKMRRWYVRMCWEAEASNVEARTGIEAMQKIKSTLKKQAVVVEATAILEKEQKTIKERG